MGWDNSVICCMFSYTCTHTSCYPPVRPRALAYIRHATPLYILMPLHTYVMLHALAYIRHATPLSVLMHLHTYVRLRCCAFSCTCTHRSCCTFSCTCTHTSYYAAVRSHALAHIRHATPLYVLMHLPHIRHATLLYVFMHLHAYVMLRCCTFSCTCTHMSCYAAVRSHALAHIRHAALLYVFMHLHAYVMLHRCTFSCASRS